MAKTFGAYQSEAVTRARFKRNQSRSESGCLEWTGQFDVGGYGRLLWRKKRWKAHRLALVFAGIELEPGKVVDHICRNRRCVNPSHLRQVTKRQNALENSVSPCAQNATKERCPLGHEYSVNRRGHRYCRVCLEKAKRDEYARRRDERLAGSRWKGWPSNRKFLAMLDEFGPDGVAKMAGVTSSSILVRQRKILSGAKVKRRVNRAKGA